MPFEYIKKVDSWSRGVKADKPIIIAPFYGVELELHLLSRFLRMDNEYLLNTNALGQPEILKPTSGYRSNAKQKALWLSRQVPGVRSRLGSAAKPGWSLHQSGRAIDIRTGLSYRAFAKGVTSPVFRWLEENAVKYGFYRTVKREPWHWALKAGDFKQEDIKHLIALGAIGGDNMIAEVCDNYGYPILSGKVIEDEWL